MATSPVARATTLGNFSPHSTRTRGVGGVDHLFEAEGGELALGLEAVEVEVVDADLGALVLVDEGEGGAGDLLGIGGVEGGGDAFDEGGLPCPEVAAEDDQARGGHEGFGDALGDGEGSGDGAGLEAAFDHAFVPVSFYVLAGG